MMDVTIVSDRLRIDGAPARYVQSPNIGGRMVPEAIVLHDTAGALRPFSSVEWFQSSGCQTSAHFVVERDGTITQMVECDVKAWHAGESSFNGRRYCNSFSVGIEIVNPGRLTRAGQYAVADFGARFPAADCLEIATAEHGRGLWLPYTPEQIDAVTQLCTALAAAYPTINDITTHWAISPGRKIDPGPQFPLDDVRAAVDAAMQAAQPGQLIGNSDELVQALGLGASGPLVETAQRQLADLGFLPGSIDARFGPRMRAAVLAFEAENKRPTDGVLDAADLTLLMSEVAKSMPLGAREEASKADLRALGSEHMADASMIKTTGLTTLGLGLADVGMSAGTGTSPIEHNLALAERGLNMAARFGFGKSFHLTGRMVAVAVLVVLGLALWRWGGRIEWRRLLEHRSGENLKR